MSNQIKGPVHNNCKKKEKDEGRLWLEGYGCFLSSLKYERQTSF